MTLGTKLHSLRTAKKISLDLLALELEVSKTAILKWETDKAKPSIENVLKLCAFYHINITDLLKEVTNLSKLGVVDNPSEAVRTSGMPNQKAIAAILENQLLLKRLMGSQDELIQALFNQKD